MQKTPELFDQWNKAKKNIEFNKKPKPDSRIGEFWWYWEGVNIGNEISKDGKFMRVCFILQNDLGNGLLLVAPITTKHHQWMEKYYIEIKDYEKYGLKQSRIIINQIKLIDRNRLIGMTYIHDSIVGFAIKVRYAYRKIIHKSKK